MQKLFKFYEFNQLFKDGNLVYLKKIYQNVNYIFLHAFKNDFNSIQDVLG